MSQQQTVCVYNGVTINFVELVEHRTEPVYDESGVLVVGRRKTIELNGVVNDPIVDTFVGKLDDLRTLLMRPRKALEVKFVESGTNAVTPWITVRPAFSNQANADVDNGPKPLHVTVNRVFGGRAAFVSFSITWTEYNCDEPDANAAVLSHRWSTRTTIDELNYGTRTVTGVLTLSTHATLSQVTNPDAYRGHIFPPYIAGWRRARMEFVLSEDYRTLRYIIEDREEFRPYPGKALTGEGNYSSIFNNGVLYKTFSITLSGAKDTKPGDLLDAVYKAMKTRIDTRAGKDIIRQATVTENLFANSISLNVYATTPGNLTTSLAPPTVTFFRPLEDLVNGVPRTLFTQPTPYGAALIRNAMQAIFDQCSIGPSPQPGEIGGLALMENVPGGAPATTTILTAQANDETIPADLRMTEDDANLSEAQAGAHPYLAVEQRMILVSENNIRRLSPASKDHNDLLMQATAPTVRFRHEGSMTRIGEPPVIVPPVGGAFTHIENFRIIPGQTALEANRSAIRYSVGYTYDVVLRRDVTDSRFSLVDIAGVPGKFVRFHPGATLAFEGSPMIESSEELAVPPGFGV